MPHCPVCTDKLLRHVRARKTYWFCQRCRYEVLDDLKSSVSPLESAAPLTPEPTNALQKPGEDIEIKTLAKTHTPPQA